MISLIFDSLPGPIPKHVTVPGGTSVKPASLIKLEVIPISLACCCNCLSSDSFVPLTTTFFCPSLYHPLKLEISYFFDLSEQITAACASCAAILPLDIPKSVLTTITSLYSKIIPLRRKRLRNYPVLHLQTIPRLLQVYSIVDLYLPFLSLYLLNLLKVFFPFFHNISS